MTYRPHCNRPHPSRGETIISTRRLDELEAKERAHDDYLGAIRDVRLRSGGPEYRRALHDLASAIVELTSRRM